MPLSIKAKEAVKTALAMTSSYGIALGMGWDKPMWAGFAVAMISLSTAGQSLNKGVMRMLGTLVAVVAALTLLALFPQDRWLFMLVLSLYVGFCTYMVMGNRYQYFWFVSAFVCMIIAFESGAESQQAFQIAVLRAQETGLGILVYSLVSIFLWPQDSRAALEGVTAKLSVNQAKLFQTYRDQLLTGETAPDSNSLRQQEVQLTGQLGATLSSAETDTYVVREMRDSWRAYHRQTTAFMQSLERWRESFQEVQELQLGAPLPGMVASCSGIDQRLQQVERMLAGQAPEPVQEMSSLEIDRKQADSLNHFEKAALLVNREQLEDLRHISQSLFENMRDIRGYAAADAAPVSHAQDVARRVLDADRLQAALRVMASLWAGVLVWIYLDPPGHSMFMFLTTLFALLAAMNGINVAMIFMPFVYGSVISGVLYVFVLPQLSGFAELGALIFMVTFATWYLFSKPAQALVKMAVIISFMVLMSIQNEQSYSFASYANSVAMLLLACVVAIAVSYVPPSSRPEKVFVRLLQRFFRHSEFLISRQALDWHRTSGWSGRWKLALYNSDVLALPQKLERWGKKIDYTLLPGTSPAQIEALVGALRALALRMRELETTRGCPQSDLLIKELLDDVRAWRLVIESIFRNWSVSPADHPAGDLDERLAGKLASLEQRISATLDLPGAKSLDDRDYVNFYRVLGSYRGLSEALAAYARQATCIDWAQWQEARF